MSSVIGGGSSASLPVGVKHLVHSTLTGQERVAAQRALSSLEDRGLLRGHGNDTFAGGVAGSQRFLSSAPSDTVAGANLSQGFHQQVGVTLSSDPFVDRTITPASFGNENTTPATTHTVALSDQTTVHLIGITPHSHN